jgi:hypothetical protein
MKHSHALRITRKMKGAIIENPEFPVGELLIL